MGSRANSTGEGVTTKMNVAHCRSCNAEIVWLKTSKDKPMPVDKATVKEGDTHYDSTRHVSHFATCKDANKWRKK